MPNDVTSFPAPPAEHAPPPKATTPLKHEGAEAASEEQRLPAGDNTAARTLVSRFHLFIKELRSRFSSQQPSDKDNLSRRIFEAELMVAHAAELGKGLKPELSAVIATARDAYTRSEWTIELTKQFWPAYSQLSVAIKPITGESLAACAGNGVARTLARYRFWTFSLALILIPLSVFMFVNTSISNDINEKIKDNDALVLNLRELEAIPQTNQTSQTPRVLAADLQQFATANRFLLRRAALLNHYILNSEDNPFTKMSDQERRAKLELPVPLLLKDIPDVTDIKITTYQDIRIFAKNVQELNSVIFGAITAYLLPVLYALLGAWAFALRSLSQQTSDKTYMFSYANSARIPIALIGGLVVGLFSNFTQGITLSPLAIAFLVGYGAEIFFAFLDTFLSTLKARRMAK
jgi:hypothetical protein